MKVIALLMKPGRLTRARFSEVCKLPNTEGLRMICCRRCSDGIRPIGQTTLLKSPLYVKYGVAEKLGQGVTKSIQYLDEGGFSKSQIDTWNSAWQQAGKGCDDLEIPLRCLDAAVEVMKSEPPTDRPLFRLPLEIRGLIRPLLNRSLGEE